jgi:hypothetical protein
LEAALESEMNDSRGLFETAIKNKIIGKSSTHFGKNRSELGGEYLIWLMHQNPFKLNTAYNSI